VQGVDVSVYQGTVDWSQVAASGRGFAIARISDGTGTMDPTFAANWAGIKAAGMVRGVYQYFRAGDDPIAQADIIVNGVGSIGPGDLPPMADVETLDGQSGDALVANLATWVGVIHSRLGVTPIVYAAPGFWDPLPATAQFATETLDVANWEVCCPDTPAPWTSWSFWQYADDGSVAGIGDAVDLEVYNGTLDDLEHFTGAVVAIPEAGAPPPLQEEAGPTTRPFAEASVEEDAPPSSGEAAVAPERCPSEHMGCAVAATGTGQPPPLLALLAAAATALLATARRGVRHQNVTARAAPSPLQGGPSP
jgi:lysozyme